MKLINVLEFFTSDKCLRWADGWEDLEVDSPNLNIEKLEFIAKEGQTDKSDVTFYSFDDNQGQILTARQLLGDDSDDDIEHYFECNEYAHNKLIELYSEVLKKRFITEVAFTDLYSDFNKIKKEIENEKNNII